MTLLAVYPFTPFKGSWIYTAMASAPAGAQGVRDALDLLIRKGHLTPEEDLKVVVLTGDGSANGMGLSSTSAAIYRKLDFIYICYDNEGYGNTGYQFSAATPHAARTATSKGTVGYLGYKKDLFSIWAAHKPAYVATVIGTEPLDLARKIEKAKDLKGAKLFIALYLVPRVGISNRQKPSRLANWRSRQVSGLSRNTLTEKWCTPGYRFRGASAPLLKSI